MCEFVPACAVIWPIIVLFRASCLLASFNRGKRQLRYLIFRSTVCCGICLVASSRRVLLPHVRMFSGLRVDCDSITSLDSDLCFVLGRLCTAIQAASTASRRRGAARAFLSQFSINSNQRWRGRGWLVLLRARHQIYLAHQQRLPQKRWRAWLWRQKLQGTHGDQRTKTADPLAIASESLLLDARLMMDVDIGLCEEGLSSSQGFAQAVVSVVGINEEDLFREIVSFL